MNNDRGKEIRVGGLIAIGLIIIFGAFFVIGGQEGLLMKKYAIHARFTSVEGLTTGAAVRLGGVKVGSVNKVTLAPDGTNKQVVVTMAINAASFDKIRNDSRARIGGQGLLGDKTVDITIGSPTEPAIRPGEFVNSVQTSQMNDLISQGGDAMADIKDAAHNLNEISFKINSGTGTLAQFINDPRLYVSLDSLLNMWTEITLKINSGQGFMAKIVNDPSLYQNLDASLSEIRQMVANINAGKGSLGKLATGEGFYNRFDSLLISASETLAKINGGRGTAGQVLNNADLYQKINSTLDALNTLIVDIKAHPNKYVKISIF